MSELKKLEKNRENILIGEIGTLLHDIGKLHPDFIGTQSLENTPQKFYHPNIDGFLNSELNEKIKSKYFEFSIGSDNSSVYKLITEHHDRDPKDKFVKYLKECDNLDSADDKGIVRRKQSRENTFIVSPFGYPKEKINLDFLGKRFEDLQQNLLGLFKYYISGIMDIGCFRKALINNLMKVFSHSLGETRIPANDVTLWDHSYSTASLFKSVLAALVLSETKLKWRVFGISWNGIGFINGGRKIADILKRREIIDNIKGKLKELCEFTYPIGNAVYEDLNGMYFTFPQLSGNKLIEVAGELSEKALNIINQGSDNEIWPVFTLSKDYRGLTIIANELNFASEVRKKPKSTPVLYVEGEVKKCFKNPEFIHEVRVGQDICPFCKIRSKDKEKERCDICDERRRGRLDEWLLNRKNTIWVDEVADTNNRIALLSLNFNLDKWLNGSMIGSLYSQSFEDWMKVRKENKENKNTTEILDDNLLNDIKFLSPLQPNKKSVYDLIEYVISNKDDNNKKGDIAKILDTFFQDVNIGKGKINSHIDNIKERLKPFELTKESLAAFLFTQNATPARLYRIWKETEEFFRIALKEIKSKLYFNKWKRIKFDVDISQLNTQKKLKLNTPYIIKIEDLKPENILVLHVSNGEFYTIESLEKFKFNKKQGKLAVEDALRQGFYYLADEKKAQDNLLKLNQGETIKPKSENIKEEEYIPFIEINRSPLSLRIIVPAADSIKIIEIITKLFNDRFEKVLGKLPLNIKLLVADRKFPMYVLLEAEGRMLEGKEFNEAVYMNPWWDVTGLRNDKYYGFYPTKQIEDDERYTLDDLSMLSKGKTYALYPGYFDFDFLGGTSDRYKISYKKNKEGHTVKRKDEEYMLYSSRPYYLYQISIMIELWKTLKNNISNSQINFIEEMLINKLREWREVNDSSKNSIFLEFVKAALIDAFGEKWDKLREETIYFLIYSACNGMMLDTIALFKHVIKIKEDNGNE